MVTSSKDDFDTVRDYLLKHPFGAKHPAVTAALKGLDDGLRTIERDRKLQAKFNTKTTTAINTTNELSDDFSRINHPTGGVGTRGHPPGASGQTTTAMTDDWHDIAKDDDAMMDGTANTYGSVLAQQVVQSIGDHSVACRTALGAVTVALHATLLRYGFSCTGIPPKVTAVNGFAPPVRVIPNFLPLDWEAGPNSIQLRYRKTNAMELHTKLDDSTGAVIISLDDVAMKMEGLDDHINTTSWSKATQNGTKLASPTLHYKSLAKLLGEFAQRFDLGEAVGEGTTAPLPAEVPPLHQVPQSVPRQPVTTPLVDTRSAGLRMPPSRPYSVGAGDLLPTGLLQYPQRGMLGVNLPGGNMVGPDHPMFRGGADGDYMDNPGMMPRYDPIGPPGGPTELDQTHTRRGRTPPGGTGIPNNDMEKRPRFGDNNMFL